jgi:hypothetical protein
MQQLTLTCMICLLIFYFKILQSIQEVRLLHLGEILESEGLVLSRVVLVHKVWGREDVHGGQRRVEVPERDPSLGCVHHRPVWHALVFLICKHLSTINTPTLHKLIKFTITTTIPT